MKNWYLIEDGSYSYVTDEYVLQKENVTTFKTKRQAEAELKRYFKDQIENYRFLVREYRGALKSLRGQK